jgi:NADH-quinone oxidoreductase subunit C
MMDPVKTLQAKYPEGVGAVEQPSARRAYVDIDAARVKDIARFVFDDLGARLITVTGVETTRGMELLYHFSFDAAGIIVTLRAIVRMPEPRIDSITDIVDGAEYIEREIADLFGVEFVGHPNPVRFLLADDWPQGVYPYRKEHRGKYPYRTEEELDEVREEMRRRSAR